MEPKKKLTNQAKYPHLLTAMMAEEVTEAYENGFNNGVKHCIQQLNHCCGDDVQYFEDAATILKEFNKERLK